MTAGTNPITHPAHRDTRRTGANASRLVAARDPDPAFRDDRRSHGGQLGPMREAEFGRRSGARI